MKHTTIALLCSLLCVSVVTSAFANDGSPRPVVERNRAIREAQEDFRSERTEAVEHFKETKDKEDFKNSMEENREQRRASISAARQTFRSERAKIHAQRLARHFSWYQYRLENVVKRLQERIDTEKADGKSVSSAQDLLDSAKKTLQSAISEGQKAVDLFAAIPSTTWDQQQPQIKTAIDQAQKARSLFAQTRQELSNVVKALQTN